MNSSESHDLLLEVSAAGGSRDSDKTGRPFLKLWSSTSEIFEIGSRTSSHGEPAKRELDEIREPIRELQKSPNDSLAKSIGEFLFDFLPDTISDFIRKEYQNVNENDGSLRLKIVTKPPGPVDLPWELIRVNGEFLSLRPTVSVVRFTPTSLSAPPLAIQPPVRILFVLSNPNDENMMRGQDEIQAVRGAIDQSKYNYDELWQPTFSQFREKLLSGQYHVVHYIGHGGVGRGDGNLILHDYPEGSYWLGTDQLISILPPTVTLLCLGTGFTSRNYQIQAFNRIGQTWGRYDLPTIVANQMPLSGGSVNSFWNIFYTNLYQTGSVGTAVTKARLHVATMSALPDWASFVLHLRSEDDTIFSIVPALRNRSFAVTEDEAFSHKVMEAKAVHAKIDSLTSILNDLKSQSSAFDEPPAGLQKVIEGTEKRRGTLVNEYNDLSRSLES